MRLYPLFRKVRLPSGTLNSVSPSLSPSLRSRSRSPNKKEKRERAQHPPSFLPSPPSLPLPSQILHRSQLDHPHPKMAFHQNRSLLRLVRHRRSHRLGNLHDPNRSLRRPRTPSHPRTRRLPWVREVPFQRDPRQPRQQVFC